MPTIECLIGELRGELQSMRSETNRRFDEGSQQFEELRADIKKVEEKADAIVVARAHEAGKIDGAIWALAKIGAGVVGLFGLAGWLFVHGIPEGLRRLFQ